MIGSFLVALALLAVLFSSASAASVASLGKYNISDVTVSGLSAGAFMAVQVHVALSSTIKGAAVFAGVSHSVNFFLSFFIGMLILFLFLFLGTL